MFPVWVYPGVDRKGFEPLVSPMRRECLAVRPAARIEWGMFSGACCRVRSLFRNVNPCSTDEPYVWGFRVEQGWTLKTSTLPRSLELQEFG